MSERRPRSADRPRDRGRPERAALLALRLLARGHLSAPELAEELGLCRRQTYRVLAVLERDGLRIEHQREGRHVYLVARREEIEEWLWGGARKRRAAREE